MRESYTRWSANIKALARDKARCLIDDHTLLKARSWKVTAAKEGNGKERERRMSVFIANCITVASVVLVSHDHRPQPTVPLAKEEEEEEEEEEE